MNSMDYRKWNIWLGWSVFAIATIVYFITIEDTVSLWDCGEYITAAYKLEVGHPPGAPLFMVLGRLFSFFADPENVAVWINRLSAISSSLTILFMFWSLTLLLKKLALKHRKELSSGDQVAIFGSAFIGSLAYTFSDSFWFSAVEGEVYAMASLFTAAIFWAILKWDEEMALVQDGTLSVEVAPNRWILLIMFLLGLAIGVHLLGILVVPAIGFVIYFRLWPKATTPGIIITGLLSIFVLGFIQEGVIPGSISLASTFEVAFVNSLGLPFFTGTVFFFLCLIGLCIYLLRYAKTKGNTILFNSVMGLILLLIGYGSFAVIVIRSNANTPLDENDPENLVTLHAYLKREQYGSAPLLSGPAWNSTENDPSLFDSRSPFYLRRFVVTKGDKDVKAFKKEKEAQAWASENGGAVEEKYFESNAEVREHSEPTYAQTMFFPRMYWSQEQQKVDGYIKWSGYDPNDGTPTEKGKDGKRLPSFGENMTYFLRYQVNWMYWRYFMWNFAGRQNDIQGHGDNMRGNWISGIGAIDNARLGNQDESAPYFTSENPANNKFFFLPLILGLIGLLFHFYRAPKDAFVLFLAFLFTGLAIVVYLNQKPLEPRERDYAYAGSFYFFAFWIGIGVYALYDAFVRFTKQDLMRALYVFGGGILLFAVLDMGSEVSMPNTIAWAIISILSLATIGIMMGLKNVTKNETQGASVAVIIGFVVPLIMGMQGFDDHDRSLKTSADDLALNYLESCAKNSVLFTNGDNDTFPLWYMQEVEGKRTDVRVCNLSLMQTDWYTEQMKMRAYDSDPLPIRFREDQTLMYAGYTDQVVFFDLFEMFYMNVNDKILQDVISMRLKASSKEAAQALESFNMQMGTMVNAITAKDPNAQVRLDQLKLELSTNTGKTQMDNVNKKYRGFFEVIAAVKAGALEMPEEQMQSFQNLMAEFEKSWNYANIKDIMAFVRDDKNLVLYDSQRTIRMFPSKGFVLPVNKENAVKSGVIKADQKKDCFDDLRFTFETRALTREQVMMLDILANNDWKRGIYFSSPGGSDVSISLYKRGYVKQNGMAFVLSPLNNLNDRYANEMYENLMSKYSYGQMSNPDVLTDYYTRRHTSQYRTQFSSLAEDFLLKAENEDRRRDNALANADILSKNGQAGEAKKLRDSVKDVDKKIADYKKKAAALIKRSLQVMPANVVMDYGEPSPDNREPLMGETGELSIYSDGVLHEYVRILYRAGEKKAAEELGLTLAKQLESIVNYFVKSEPYFAGNPENTGDLYAALGAYFRINLASLDPESGDANGKLAKQTSTQIDSWYKKAFPSIVDKLSQMANDNGESTGGGLQSAGRYARMMLLFKDYTNAIGVQNGYLRRKEVPVDTSGQNGEIPVNIDELMKQQGMPPTDTMKKNPLQ
jgi:hypothetical protein